MLKFLALFTAFSTLALGCQSEGKRAADVSPSAPKSGVGLYVAFAGDKASPQGKEALGNGKAIVGGCDEVFVEKSEPLAPNLSAEDTVKKLVELSLGEGSQLRVAKVELSGHNATVKLEGKPVFAGTCGVPRLKFAVEKTLKIAYLPRIELNGSEKAWRCLGDESGECK